MVLSASRRTDIPRFYTDWLLNRLQAGFALVRNPMNHGQVSRVELDRDTVECIAFWTKNPAPMLPLLPRLEPYPFFVQFTLNGYGPAIEGGLPPEEELVETFTRLAGAIGPQRMVWRYSPILCSATHTPQWHLEHFAALARRLQGHTALCRVSYLDLYKKISPRMNDMGIRDVPEGEKTALTKQLVEIGAAHGITLGGCGNMDLAAAGLTPLGCIDAALVARTVGMPVKPGKDPGQRGDCYCMPSVDIGSYNTCLNGCAYCYANHATESVRRRHAACDPAAPMLCDALRPGDIVTTRSTPSVLQAQTRLY